MDRSGAATLTFCGALLIVLGASLVATDGLFALCVALAVLGIVCTVVGVIRYRWAPAVPPTRAQLRGNATTSTVFLAIGALGLLSAAPSSSSIVLLVGGAAMQIYSLVRLRRMPPP